MTKPNSSSALQAGGDETPVARVSDLCSNRIGWLDTKAAFDLPEGTELFTRPTPAAAAGVPTDPPHMLMPREDFDRIAAIKPWESGYHGWGSYTHQHDYRDGKTAVWLLSALASPVAPAGVPTCHQVTEQHPVNKAFWDGVRWAQDGAVLSAGAPAAQQLVVVGYRRKVPILTGYSYEVCWHWSTKAGEGWEPIYGCLSDGEQSADQGAPEVPLHDFSSVHQAADDSSRALRAASRGEAVDDRDSAPTQQETP